MKYGKSISDEKKPHGHSRGRNRHRYGEPAGQYGEGLLGESQVRKERRQKDPKRRHRQL